MAARVALVIGAGKNIGAGVANALSKSGYKVAVTSRTSNHGLDSDNYLSVKCDLANPSDVKQVFETVEQQLGPPTVVVYNAATHIPSPDKENPLALSLSELQKTIDINFSGAYVAAQNAVAAFDRAPADSPKTFIYTGNRTNIAPIVPLLSLGIGKSAGAHLMNFLTQAYQKKGYKFYYADERDADGSPVYNRIDGPAHGKFFAQLAQGEDSVPWLATFVKNQGYKDFGEMAKM